MVRDVRTRIIEILQHRHVQIDAFTLKPLALTFEQVQEYNLPKNFAKEKDSRFKAYKKQYGDKSWEVDALRPDVMAEIIGTEICRYLNKPLFDEMIDEEDHEKEHLRAFIATFSEVKL
jgi:hypothetical protein